MSHPARVDVSVKWEHGDELAALYFRAKPADGDRVLRDADIELIGNFAGAINKAREPYLQPPPVTTDFCDADAIRLTIPWGDYARRETRSIAPFGRNALCVAFVLPPGPFAWPGYVSLAEFGGSPAARHMTISRSPCDFRPAGPGGPVAASFGKQVTLYFNDRDADAVLEPGAMYFCNVRNWDATTGDWSVAPDGVAPAGISIVWPH